MSINLLPWRQKRALFRLKTLVTFLILLNITSTIMAYYYNANLKYKILCRNKKIAEISASSTTLGQLLIPGVSAELTKLQKTIHTLNKNHLDNEQLLAQLMRFTANAHNSIRIYALTLNTGKIRAKGFAKNERSLNHYVHTIHTKTLNDIDLAQQFIGESLAFDLTATRIINEKSGL